METVTAWLLATMIAFSPLAAWEHYKTEEARETAEQRAERYAGIASAVARVAFDPEERPLFDGPTGRHATATLLLGLAWKESAWRRDVDLGLGKLARGGGTDTCLLQIRLARWVKDGEVVDARTREGWDWRDLVADREKCFRAGLRIVRLSMGACRKYDPEHALAAYARGRCEDPVGQSKSRERVLLGRTLLALRKLPSL